MNKKIEKKKGGGWNIWTQEEVNILKKLYIKSPKEEILKKLPNRTWESIKYRSKYLQIKRIKKYRTIDWTERELNILKQYYPLKPQEYLFKKLSNRTLTAIKSKATELKIKKQIKYNFRRWTKQELKMLKDSFPDNSAGEIQKLIPNRSIAGIRQKARELRFCKKPKEKIKVVCKYCGKISYQRYVRKVTKHCSKECSNKTASIRAKKNVNIKKFKEGHIPWNKGKSPSEATLKKIFKGLSIRPTKPEIIIKNILDKYFSGEFVYNGDFSQGFMLRGLVPDFVNCNGKKQVIEVFGDYWHDPERCVYNRTEEGRKKIFSQLGYKTLVIWGHELISDFRYGKQLSEKEIVNKITNFMVGEKL